MKPGTVCELVGKHELQSEGDDTIDRTHYETLELEQNSFNRSPKSEPTEIDKDETSTETQDGDKDKLTEDEIESITHYPNVRRSCRQRQKPEKFSPDCAMVFGLPGIFGNDETYTPTTFRDAQSSVDNHKFDRAMKEETKGFVSTRT